MPPRRSKFLTDSEKLTYFANIAGVNLKEYSETTTLKIYEGLEILIYHYEPGEKLVFDTVLKCTGFNVTGTGVKITLIDKKTYQIYTVGDVPNKMEPYDILAHVPYRCTVEKTVKLTSSKRMTQGTAAGISFRSGMDLRKPMAMPLIKAFKYFSTDEYNSAIEGYNDTIP